MIPLPRGLVLIVFGIILGILICIITVMRDKKREIKSNEEKAEEIIRILLKHADCEHDDIEPSSDTPGEHHVSYNIGKIGTEKIREILEGA